MKKILKTALISAAACVMAMVFAVSAYAATETVDLPVSHAKKTNGGWGQSITYYKNTEGNPSRVEFDCGRITPDTIVYVEYILDGEWTASTSPVELILQRYNNVEENIWAKAQPYEWDETSASFNYQAMVEAYGSDDLSTVDNLWLGDANIPMLVTKFSLTNCTVIEEETTASETEEESDEAEPDEDEDEASEEGSAEEETTTAAETKKETEAAADTAAAEADAPEDEADTTEASSTTEAASSDDQSEGGIMDYLIFIIVGAVAVIAIVVVVIVIAKKPKNKFY